MIIRHFILQNTGCIAFGEHGAFAQAANLPLTFFAEIVSFAGLLVQNFSATGYFEALFGAAICFHFWHDTSLNCRNTGGQGRFETHESKMWDW